jgi:lipopolysaccharide transport system ATP-binding protein
MQEFAIEINNVSKRFYIGESVGITKSAIQHVSRIIPTLMKRLSAIWRGKAPTYVDQELWALKDVNLHIKRGDTVGIIGKNGSGKSTLLQLVANVMSPTTGEIITRGHVAAMLNVGTGFHPELTGRENIYINASIFGLSQNDIDAVYDSIVDFAEIHDFMDTPLKRYSSGMRVRLAFSVAIHVKPDIIILDEVLAVGDLSFREKCIKAIMEFYEDTTVLIVSHNINYLKRICDNIIWMKDGEVYQEGDADSIINAYRVASRKESFSNTNDYKNVSDNNRFDLLDLQLINPRTQSATNVTNSDTGLDIRLQYTLLEDNCTFRVTCRFINTDAEVLVFTCSDADTQSRHQESRTTGTYRAKFLIPENLFAVGKYQVDVVFDDPLTNQILAHWENALKFRIVDTRSERLNWFKTPKEGLINYDITWNYDLYGEMSHQIQHQNNDLSKIAVKSNRNDE